MAVELDCVIPLPQAAKRMGMTVEALTRLVTSGKLKAMKTSSGEVVVPESETQSAITHEQFKHLRGKRITVGQAAQPGPRDSKKNEGGYDVPDDTIRIWVARGYVKVLESGYGMKLDEADVAYCAAIYHQHKSSGSRAPLLDKDGHPYVLKNPQMAEYQRERRKRKDIATPRSARVK